MRKNHRPSTLAGSSAGARFARAPLAQAVSLAVLLTLSAQQAALAQQPQGGGAPAAISIAAMPLSQALTELARQTGTTLVAAPALLAGKQAPAVSGNLAPQQALKQLLAGSGLEGSLRNGVITVHQAPPESGVVTLAPVTVTAQAERNGVTEGTGSFTTGSTNAATGMNLSLRETPQSVSVITRERMDQQQLNSAQDVLNQTTGIFVHEDGPQMSSRGDVYSRGYKITSYQVDGVSDASVMSNNWNAHIGGIDTAIYDSVTVVRGATGLLSGYGEPSATVSLTRKRPTHDFQASLEAGYGRWGKYRVAADIGGPLNAAGTLRGRLVAAHQDDSYWISKYKGNRSVFYGVLEADIGSQTVLTTAVQYGQTKSNDADGGNAGFPIFWDYDNYERTPFGRYDSDLADYAKFNQNASSFSVALEHAFSDNWNGKLSYSYGKNDSNMTRVFTYDPRRDERGNISFYNGWDYIKEMENNSYNIDARLNGKFNFLNRQHEIVAGYNIANSRRKIPIEGEADVWGTPVGFIDASGQFVRSNLSDQMRYYTGSTPFQKTEQSGLFLGTRLYATDRLSAILGARWSTWKYHQTESLYGYENRRKYSNEFIPYAGLTYDINKNFSAYTSYTETFYPQSYYDISGNLLDPEQGKNYEIGLKGKWLDGRLNANIAIFQLGKDNMAIPLQNEDGSPLLRPDGSTAYKARDNTKNKGWEMEISGQLAPGWQLQAGYTKSRLKDSDGRGIFYLVPTHQFKLFTSYTLRNVPGLILGGGVNWQSERTYSHIASYSDERIKRTRIPSYAVVNLMASYEVTNNLTLTVNVNNALNKDYRLSGTNHVYGAKRNINANIKYKF